MTCPTCSAPATTEGPYCGKCGAPMAMTPGQTEGEGRELSAVALLAPPTELSTPPLAAEESSLLPLPSQPEEHVEPVAAGPSEQTAEADHAEHPGEARSSAAAEAPTARTRTRLDAATVAALAMSVTALVVALVALLTG